MHSNVNFDHIRYSNIIKNNTNNWDPKSAMGLLWMSSYFDNTNIIFAKKLFYRQPVVLIACYGNF